MLETLALVMLCLSVTAIFYIFIFIHDLPHRMAKKRNHPQQEAIHYACWLSLFTLHAIWPLVFLWSVSNRDPVRVAVEGDGEPSGAAERIAALEKRIAELESKNTGGEG
jgi:hypothetical protein